MAVFGIETPLFVCNNNGCVSLLFEEVEVPLDLWTQAIMINGLTGELV